MPRRWRSAPRRQSGWNGFWMKRSLSLIHIWAVETGISDGSNMSGTVTRQQMAAMLYRYAGSPAVTDSLSGFPDAADVSDYAVDAMTWAVENGLITGMTDGTLNPYGWATRAQVATILQRFMVSLAE